MKKPETVPEGEDRNDQVVERVWNVVDPVLRSEGMEVIEIEYRREAPGWVLRVYVDQERGVTVEDCARVSHVVGDLLDVADIIRNPYNLEVSSPGLNRPLRKKEHFEKCLEKFVEVKTFALISGRRNFKGSLKEVREDGIIVECDGRRFEIPFEGMDRARLRYFESQHDRE